MSYSRSNNNACASVPSFGGVHFQVVCLRIRAAWNGLKRLNYQCVLRGSELCGWGMTGSGRGAIDFLFPHLYRCHEK